MARQTLAADQSSEKLWVFLCDCCGDGAGRSRTSLIACRYQPCCWGLQAALNLQHTSLASITCEKLCVNKGFKFVPIVATVQSSVLPSHIIGNNANFKRSQMHSVKVEVKSRHCV